MVGDCPALSFAEASLQGIPAFEGVSSSSQSCTICELAQCPFQSCSQVIYEDVEEHMAKDGVLQTPSSDRWPVSCHSTHYNYPFVPSP
ncbi:hypothetical protein HGM15179_021798 [Zosterops borbonicus]|uniref:Uncharacterized protein n=1 Tax=Zosterops borbonicus TaxID=364589 RepID=A0A8K1D3S4_9PASS|nr:hypothetical protein HGM15179_021798 [Zosterops borbonicus]